ncbi:MAG: hypothetical protein GC201_16375 [Alphaproteobacteria bacterium]|nr:hypothetical protein [Alphaproteobacteria bacterium]
MADIDTTPRRDLAEAGDTRFLSLMADRNRLYHQAMTAPTELEDDPVWTGLMERLHETERFLLRMPVATLDGYMAKIRLIEYAVWSLRGESPDDRALQDCMRGLPDDIGRIVGAVS